MTRKYFRNNSTGSIISQITCTLPPSNGYPNGHGRRHSAMPLYRRNIPPTEGHPVVVG